ncbi:S-layer homology domain-containing protein [Peribacillus loiseleuriae]|uniref:SLH domain-containing protein n=1 Tax=Peribacillus loiseleuriae TaxID=1679170 RepID=A0A0K9GZ65_9BACI|nr:S-layer homology domain-containing protein [Peribacillus loiseleuriae]KMY51916.1 hypothetical protein AC625_22285 [Peribacillus loiseleuriae]
MAYQSKSHRKFLATSLTAAVVASAIAPTAGFAAEAKTTFPDVPAGHWAEKAISYLVEKGALEGRPDGKFDPTAQITRGEAAKILAVTLGLKIDDNAKASFKDTANHWASKYVAAIEGQTKDVINGYSKTEFRPNQKITRQEMAKMVVSAYDLKLDEAADIAFTDNNGWGKDYVSTLASLGVVEGISAGKFSPDSSVTRAQTPVFIHRAEVKEVRVEVPSKVAAVNSVSAINGTTLQVNGTNLAELKAEDVTVEGNKVSEVTVAADGKSATVKLGSPLLLDSTTKVTVKGKSFDVTYKVEVKGVTILENQTYDHDRSNQFVKIQVDGKELTPQELITAGYEVEFRSFTSKTGVTVDNDIFKSVTNNVSTTGELNKPISLNSNSSRDFYVRVTVTKGSEVMESALTKVTIKNLTATASSISNAKISVTSNSSTFDLVSSTLAAGDQANFKELEVAVGGSKEYVSVSAGAAEVSVKSSDESVISVDKSTHELTANGPGTATITVTYGGATYTKSLTVKSEKRKIANVKLGTSALFVGKTTPKSTNTFTVQAVDQYGDPILATGTNAISVQSSDASIATATSGALTSPSSNGKLEYTVTVTGEDKGTADLTIRDAGNARIGSAVRVTVGENTAIARYTLTVDSDISDGDVAKVIAAGGTGATKNQVSTSSTIDTGANKYVKINLAAFNSAGQELASPEAGTNYEVTGVNVSKANVLDTTFGTNGVSATDDYLVVKAGSAAGTVTITVTDKNNASAKQTIGLTVTDKGATVTGVTFKNVPAVTYATLLNYEDFLSLTKSSKDPIISGLTLSKSFSQAVRLTTGVPAGTTTNLTTVDALYVDLNGDGQYTSGEPVIGFAGMATTGDIVATGSTGSVTARDGYEVRTGSDGNVIFRVYNDSDEIVASKVVKVDF